KKDNILAFNVRTTWSGNQRFIPIDLEASSLAGETVLQNDGDKLINAFSERLPDYFRIDLQVSHRKNRAKSTRIWRLEIQNVTSRENVQGIYYDSDVDRIVEETQLGIIPVLSYRIEF
ncbi:MAG: TonB-dependent receptor, partial [Bacteroidetes bacterium]|nr:TonB-dependent receptor [Bacteroidota bacterium]